jgi:prepilin-type N-terminal cleavage/methylation domain-containing protein
MTHRTERGDSLIEIIIAIVVIGVVVSAITAAISTSENGSAAHRQLVTGDTVLRNYAESVKQAVRTSCTSTGGTWSASYSEPGYSVNTLSGQTCPAVTTTAVVPLQVTLPNGTVKSLSIVARTP